MQLTNTPAKLVLPFANAGAKNTIPTASQIGITAGAASLVDGFPPLTRTPIAAGGVPPSGLDMNGILYALSAILRWANAGGGYAYDAAFATDSNVGGYPKGARVLRSDGLGYWFNTTDNNTTDPEAAGAAAAGWVPDFTNGVTAVTMTSANVTLTPLQYGKPIIVITGTLTANLNLIFPAIVNEWTVINNTTGPYTITCKTASGTGLVVNTAALIVGDGTNIQSAVTDAAAIFGETVATATGGTADAITATFAPVPRYPFNGVPLSVRATAANATTTPTFTPAPGTIAAKTIVKGAGSALAAGDIAGAGHWIELQYDATLDKWVLLNPATGVSSGVVPAALQRQTYTAFSTAGSAPAYTLSPVPAVGALAAGHRFMVIFHAAGTTGSNTLNVSGLGAASLWQYDATGTLVPAVIPADGIRGDVEYDGANWILLNPLPTAGAPSPVRQTVLGGPVDSAGAPSFLPATSGSLSLTSQNVAAGAPLVVSAANGFAAAGAVDRIGISTGNLTWSGLSASATNYLYVDVSAAGVLTPGSTTLAPNYQWGGTRSTTNGQATYNIAEASMTVGNGSAAAQTYRVFVGEAVTGASSVTSTVGYAYQGRAVFEQATLAVGTTYAFGTNIGTPNQVLTGWLECKTAELGYVVGESIGVTWAVNPYSAAQSVYMTLVNRNRADVVTGTTYIGTTSKSGATGVGLTPANWKVRATASRGW